MPQRNWKPNPTASSSNKDADGTKECNPNPKKRRDRSIFARVEDDILREILLRLPRESLLSSRLVSTRWFNASTEPSFIRSYRSLHPSMLGFFFHRSQEDPPLFVPTSRSSALKEAAERVGSTLDFLPHQDSLHILDSCGGWLLLAAGTTKGNFYVCNPMRKEWVEIPPPPSAKRETLFVIGLTCSEKNPSGFQVVRMVKPGERPPTIRWYICHYDFEVETFSSETQTWRINIPMYDYRSFSHRIPKYFCSFLRSGNQALPVFVGGVLYWLTDESKFVAYNEKRSDCALVELDLPEYMSASHFNTACLGKAEGHLCYALVDPTHLRIWVLSGDYPKLKWTLKHRIEWGPQLRSDIQDYELNPLMFLEIDGQPQPPIRVLQLNMQSYISLFVRPIGFHSADGNIVFLSILNKAFSYHLQNRELKDLSCEGHGPITRIFPYVMPESSIPVIGTTAEPCSSGH